MQSLLISNYEAPWDCVVDSHRYTHLFTTNRELGSLQALEDFGIFWSKVFVNGRVVHKLL